MNFGQFMCYQLERSWKVSKLSFIEDSLTQIDLVQIYFHQPMMRPHFSINSAYVVTFGNCLEFFLIV